MYENEILLPFLNLYASLITWFQENSLAFDIHVSRELDIAGYCGPRSLFLKKTRIIFSYIDLMRGQ